MRRRQRGLQFYRKKKGLSMQAVKEVFSWIVLVVGIFIWVFDAVGGVVVNGIITLVKG